MQGPSHFTTVHAAQQGAQFSDSFPALLADEDEEVTVLRHKRSVNGSPCPIPTRTESSELTQNNTSLMADRRAQAAQVRTLGSSPLAKSTAPSYQAAFDREDTTIQLHSSPNRARYKTTPSPSGSPSPPLFGLTAMRNPGLGLFRTDSSGCLSDPALREEYPPAAVGLKRRKFNVAERLQNVLNA